MKHMKYLILFTIISLSLTACSTLPQQIMSSKERSIMYDKAQQKLQKGKFKNAIKKLEILNNQYLSRSDYQQIKLQLIYAYYKRSNLIKARSMASEFIHFNPNHSNLDYVIYMRGVINMELFTPKYHKSLLPNSSLRDSRYAQDAYQDFIHLLSTYPNSKYAADSHKRLIFLQELLAKFELPIIRLYSSKGAYIAVINRVESMLKHYPNTIATRKALPILQYAYRKLHCVDEANKVAKIIAFNHEKI